MQSRPSLTPWPRERYLAMDARFRGAMLDAIEAGLENMPEVPVRVASTLPKHGFVASAQGDTSARPHDSG